MRLGKVIGNIVATRKDESLVGAKLMITQPLDLELKSIGQPLVMVDTVGAGIGEIVMFAQGTAARNAVGKPEASIDAAIVGIVDKVDVDKNS